MLIKYQIDNNTLSKNDNGNILYYYKISEDEKEYINKNYLIDLHTLSSALDPEEVPRFEINKENLTLIWKIPSALKLGDYPSFSILSLGFFLTKDNLIIISSDYCQLIDEKSKLDISSLIGAIFAIQNNTIKHFIEHLKVIKLISRDIQEKINESMENEYLLQMFNLSEILIFYLDAINGNKILLNKLLVYLKANNADPYIIDYLNDIIIENEQASKQAEIYSQIFAGLMDARGTIVNNNMNVMIKNLTVINIIFLPLNLIASIGGMSEFSMMTQKIPWPISYGIFTVSMLVIGWLTYLWISKIEKKSRKYKKK
ncbi:MAG: magnesium transporter CorA family protein [Spirochaetes bacterium]|nr:magnesium transporter CorA family protein [Spirochaetota bacterium]